MKPRQKILLTQAALAAAWVFASAAFSADSEPHQKIKLCGSDEASCTDVSVISGINRARVDATISGASDGTRIGNSGDRLKVDVQLSVDISNILNIGFGASITAPAWPAVKPLAFYIVPTGKTFKMLGVAYKTSASTTYVSIFQRKVLWKFAVATANPGAPTLTAKTITGSGLATLSTYRYKIVGVTHVGKTSGGTEASVALTGTQNSVGLSWAAVAGVSYYEIHRTAAGGAVNDEALIATTEATTYTDVSPDSERDLATIPPGSNTTAGSADGLAFAANAAGAVAVVDTLAPITTATPLDIIYRNIYGERKHVVATPGVALGAQVEIVTAGKTNPSGNNRIPPGLNKKYVDIAINDVLSVGNTPATGGFVVYGITHIFNSAAQAGNRWETSLFENAVKFSAGEEIAFGVSANVAVTAAARQDVILLGVLE